MVARPRIMSVMSKALGITLEQRCRLAFLQGIRDHEERVGRPLPAEELRRALLRYPEPRPERARIRTSPSGR